MKRVIVESEYYYLDGNVILIQTLDDGSKNLYIKNDPLEWFDLQRGDIWTM